MRFGHNSMCFHLPDLIGNNIVINYYLVVCKDVAIDSKNYFGKMEAPVVVEEVAEFVEVVKNFEIILEVIGVVLVAVVVVVVVVAAVAH